MGKVNIKKIDLSQFMLDEDDEMMMDKMDKKSLPDEDIKPSVNLDMMDEATLEENITSAGDYYDYDGRETIDDLNDLGISVSADEINYLTGLTSNIQTQLDNRYTETEADNKFSVKAGSSSITRSKRSPVPEP